MNAGRTAVRTVRSLTHEQWWALVAGVERVAYAGRPVVPAVSFAWGDWGDVLRCRDAGLVWVAGHCGLRVGEMVGLRWGDLAGPGGTGLEVAVRSAVAKRGMGRVVPMEDHVRSAVERLRRAVDERGLAALERPVFGRAPEWRPLTVRRVQQIVRRLGREHLGVRLTPHVLRHTFAARLRREVDVAVVQVLLGHLRLASTQVYMNVRRDELWRAVQCLSE